MRSEDISTLNPMPARSVAQNGDLTPVPAGSANGTLLGGRPKRASTVIFYLAAADSVTYTIAGAQPGAPPVATILVNGADFAKWPEEIGPDTQIYITAVGGTPTYRWV